MNRTIIAQIVIAAMLVFTSQTHAQPFVDGIDVSHWQGTINWTSVKNAGIDFAFTKATQGNSYVDSTFLTNMQNATAAGVLIGPYHFADVDTDIGNPLDPVNEANHFLDLILPYYNSGMYLPPVADVEGLPDFPTIAEERAFISNWVQVFSDTVNNALGVRPLIYSSLWSANNYYTPSVASNHDLWLAWWKNSTSNPPAASDLDEWDEWMFWQYTSTGSVSGIGGNVDRDVFNGTLQELNQLTVGTNPGGNADLVMITDFESDEGYFNWSPSFSGSTTANVSSSTADRSDAEAHDGSFSQLIDIVYDESSGSPFTLRHVSGIGSVASPAGNLALTSTGFLGFWLKTDDEGLTVRIAVDDPSPAIDRGLEQAVISDNQWHLYQWDLEDDSQWDAWVGGADGQITGATVTLDSIQFFGSSDAVIFLDDLAHNPGGSLLPTPGDFDGDVDGDDLTNWQSGFGLAAGAVIVHGDADNDADVDGQDFLIWQSNFIGPGVLSTAAAVPEPASFAMLLSALAGLAMLAPRLSAPRNFDA